LGLRGVKTAFARLCPCRASLPRLLVKSLEPLRRLRTSFFSFACRRTLMDPRHASNRASLVSSFLYLSGHDYLDSLFLSVFFFLSASIVCLSDSFSSDNFLTCRLGTALFCPLRSFSRCAQSLRLVLNLPLNNAISHLRYLTLHPQTLTTPVDQPGIDRTHPPARFSPGPHRGRITPEASFAARASQHRSRPPRRRSHRLTDRSATANSTARCTKSSVTRKRTPPRRFAYIERASRAKHTGSRNPASSATSPQPLTAYSNAERLRPLTT